MPRLENFELREDYGRKRIGRFLERRLVPTVIDQLDHREPKIEVTAQVIVHESVRPPIGPLVAQYRQAHDRANVSGYSSRRTSGLKPTESSKVPPADCQLTLHSKRRS